MSFIKKFENFEEKGVDEKKGEKWIKDAIKKPGSLRKSLGKKESEKISKPEIDSELQALRGKDKDPKKKGVQGLSKNDLSKYRKLNLAKTLKGLKEHQETQNYMFFGNLQTMKRLIDKMLEMDEAKVDEILKDHNWALDHIATSKDDVEEVFNFLAGHKNDIDHGFQTQDMMSGDDSEEVQEVGCGCCDECNGQSDCECCDECTCNQSVINKDDGYPVNLADSVIKSFQNFK